MSNNALFFPPAQLHNTAPQIFPGRQEESSMAAQLTHSPAGQIEPKPRLSPIQLRSAQHTKGPLCFTMAAVLGQRVKGQICGSAEECAAGGVEEEVSL